MSSTEWFVLYERMPWLTVLRPFFQNAIPNGARIEITGIYTYASPSQGCSTT